MEINKVKIINGECYVGMNMLENEIKKNKILETENTNLKQALNEIREDIVFCINGVKNEYACTDKRTNRELHTMAKILKESLQKIDKALGGNEEMLKINDKVMIKKGVAKSDKIWTVISKPYDVCDATLIKIKCEDKILNYDVTFLKKVDD